VPLEETCGNVAVFVNSFSKRTWWFTWWYDCRFILRWRGCA